MAKLTPKPADYIGPLNVNGLQGRMLRLPSLRPSNNIEILLIYGHHAKLERWWGVVQNFADYGQVTMPDLPGFGGMDSFYKIGQKPTIDNLADYLASFVKLRYKRRRFVVVGISFGFAVVTRMLQRYPEIARKVDLAVSMMGFMSEDDFVFSAKTMWLYRTTSKLLSLPPMPLLFRLGYINRWAIGAGYGAVRTRREKRIGDTLLQEHELDPIMETELDLWQANDVRTHMATTNEFLRVDNTKRQVNVPVFQISTKGDFYVDSYRVEQRMRVVFSDFTGVTLHLDRHTPSVIASKEESAPFVPRKLRGQLIRLSRRSD